MDTKTEEIQQEAKKTMVSVAEYSGFMPVGYGGKLFIGSFYPCQNPETLRDINVIINVAEDLTCPANPKKMHYQFFVPPTDFKKKAHRTEYKMAVAKTVLMLRQGKKVLVHCDSGNNQSVVVAAGVLTLLKAQPGFGMALYSVTKKRGTGQPDKNLIDSAYEIFETMNKTEKIISI